MGKNTIWGGIRPAGPHRIRFDFSIDRTRFRPTVPWPPNESNMRRARERLVLIKTQIAAGTFSFWEEFPDYRYRARLGIPARTLTCSDVFDDFLRHTEARVARGEIAPSTLTSHRQILDHVWRPTIGRVVFLNVRHSMLSQIADAHDWSKKTYNNAVSTIRRAFEFGYRDHLEQRDPAAQLKSARIRRHERLIAAIHREWGQAQGNYEEFRFFSGLRPSEQISLLLSDFDPDHGVLHVTKARVRRINRDVTKTGDARRISLCPRALRVLERQLQLREELQHSRQLDHEHLFFSDNGAPFLDLRRSYKRWRSTLRRLPIRYRKPYVARHSSVSWNLTIGRNPLWVAQQHGHSLITMLAVCAAWTEGTVESDVIAIRHAMGLSAEELPRHQPIVPLEFLFSGSCTAHNRKHI